MVNWPEDQNQWTEEHWAEFHALRDRHERLEHDLINLTIQKHGGFDPGPGWIGLDMFAPGSRKIQLDGDFSLKDLEILADLLRLPSTEEYKTIEEFDFKRFETIREVLKNEVIAMGLVPDLEPEHSKDTE